MVHPFPFEKLRKFTGAQRNLISQILKVFPAKGYDPSLVDDLTQKLKKYFGETFWCRYESLFESSRAQFISSLPERFVVLVVSLTPLSKKIIIELDPVLSLALIDKLLGGSGKSPEMVHQLTPLQEGVLQFVAVKVLKELSQATTGSSYKLRFEKIVTSVQSLPLPEEEGDALSLLTFRFRVEKEDGYIRLALSHSFLSELAHLQEAVFNPEKTASYRYSADRGHAVEHFRTLVWAELGSVNLTTDEIGSLSRGDVLLLEEVYPRYDGKEMKGTARLHVGAGTHGFIDTSIERDGDAMGLRLNRVVSEGG